MFTSNPFAGIAPSIAPGVMQGFVILMIVLVTAGTLFDILHKGSARYFFENWRKSKTIAKRKVGAGEMIAIATQTAFVDVLASGEFCNTRRRIAQRSLAGRRAQAGKASFAASIAAAVSAAPRLGISPNWPSVNGSSTAIGAASPAIHLPAT